MNLMHLVKFVVSREEGKQGQYFKVDATDSPVVHLVVVVSIGQETLWWSVPTGRDVLCEGRLRVNSSAGPKVSQLHLVVFDEDVLSIQRDN